MKNHAANLLLALLAAPLLFAGCQGTSLCNTCGWKPNIRPIDRVCLPAGASRTADIPLYRADIDAQYTQIAYIDSFACTQCDAKDGIEPETIRLMLEDLKAKARAAGADAVIRVKLLSNKLEGFKENPRTPFYSVMQGTWEQPFFRGIAIRWDGKPPREARELAEPVPPPVGIAVPLRNTVPPTGEGTLPIPPESVPQPTFPRVDAPQR